MHSTLVRKFGGIREQIGHYLAQAVRIPVVLDDRVRSLEELAVIAARG